ncbi:MAG: glutamate--tRNA ligase [Anaerolineales bacterium]|nr:glutamate--tRNA ligase [Anaerolineales bacterium]
MSKTQIPARVRFAPSPTGFLHIGGARTALYDYLLARQTGGAFVLRIEDTDQKRYQSSAETDFKNALTWMNIQPDEGPDQGGSFAPYRQSERSQVYRDHAQRLIANGQAYPCFCSAEKISRTREEQIKNNQNPHYDGTCRSISPEEANERVISGDPHVIRFNTPKEGKTTVVDLLRGEITVDNSTLDDIVLVKTDGLAVYHLAAMVDDYLMGITHVIRGSEWLPTFPIHALIYRALGWQEPLWVHLSVLLKPDGKGKMSKRDTELAQEQGFPIFMKDMDEMGYIPEAVINWIMLMGWSYDDKAEFFTLEDLVEKFSLEKLNPSPAAINFSKLDHFNGLHIRNLDVADFAKRIHPWFEKAGYKPEPNVLLQVAAAIQERTKKLTEVVDMAGFFFQEDVQLAAERVVSENMSASQAAEAAGKILTLFENLAEINQEKAEAPLRELAEEMELKAGKIFGLLREALTGQQVSPPLFDIIPILGREKVLARLQGAQEVLAGLENK